jgi:hypothetical protein
VVRVLGDDGWEMDDQKFVISSSSVLRRNVKLLILAAFKVVSLHQSTLGPCGGGYGRFPLCLIHKEGLCPNNGDINRLMMMMTLTVSQEC